MLEQWFSNVGPKIRRFAMVSFVVESIAAILSGLAIVMEDSDEFLMAFGIIIFGILGAYWVSVFIAGIGENIESTTAVKETNQQILAELKKLNQKTAAPAVPVIPAAPAAPVKAAAPKEPEATWTCHSCKTVNPVKLQYCTKCHATQAWSNQASGIPTTPKPKAQKGLYEHLVFASNYSTDEGMRAYLSRIARDKLTPAEQNDLSALLAQESLSSAVQNYLKLYH